MAFGVKEDILRLEISVDDAVLVEVLEGENNFGGVKPGSIFGEANLVTQVVKQLSAVQEIAHEVELLRVLECEMELDDEGMVDLLHNVALNLCVGHLLGPDHEILLQRLHGVDGPVRFFLHHVNFPERASSDDF